MGEMKMHINQRIGLEISKNWILLSMMNLNDKYKNKKKGRTRKLTLVFFPKVFCHQVMAATDRPFRDLAVEIGCLRKIHPDICIFLRQYFFSFYSIPPSQHARAHKVYIYGSFLRLNAYADFENLGTMLLLFMWPIFFPPSSLRDACGICHRSMSES